MKILYPKFKLSKKRQRWAKQFKPTAIVRGKPLNYPVGVEVRYVRSVNSIINEVIKETEKTVAEIFATPTAKQFFAEDASITSEANRILDELFARLDKMTKERAKTASTGMATASNLASRAAIAASLKELSGGLTIKPSLLGGQIQDKLKASVSANVDLITSIKSSYLGKVKDAVNRSIMTGRGLQDLQPFMEKQRGITKRHAKNVALDQTRKAYNSLNAARMRSAGLTKFEWLHTGGSQKPRILHITNYPEGLNGGIFDLDDPPIINKKTGARGLPADEIFCHCRMIPVLVFDEGLVAA